MKKTGFSLIKSFILIIILVGFVLPAYQSHVQKSNRVSAQLALTAMAQQFERINARWGQYPTNTEDAVIAVVEHPESYIFKANSSADSFTITATPVSGGINETDTCGILSIDHTREAQASGTGDCW